MQSGVDRAIAALEAGGLKRHRHGRRCMNLLRHVLHPAEETILEARQSKLVDIAPARVIATRRRLIIIDPSFWGLYFGHDIADSTHYVIIPYKHIIGMTMSKGLLFASIKIHTIGGEDPGSLLKGENEIHGLKKREAVMLGSFIEDIVEYEEEEEEEREARHEEHPMPYSFHHEDLSVGKPFAEAKAAVLAGRARFVWMGVEPVGDVARLFGVADGRILQLSGSHLLKHTKEQIEKLGPVILVSYDGILGLHTAKLMKKRFGTEPEVVRGGIIAVAREQREGADEFLS